MKKLNIISDIFYIFAIINFVTYLITHKSIYMFCGGLLLIVASTIIIISKKSTNK